jgi:hypothetical protein
MVVVPEKKFRLVLQIRVIDAHISEEWVFADLYPVEFLLKIIKGIQDSEFRDNAVK